MEPDEDVLLGAGCGEAAQALDRGERSQRNIGQLGSESDHLRAAIHRRPGQVRLRQIPVAQRELQEHMVIGVFAEDAVLVGGHTRSSVARACAS